MRFGLGLIVLTLLSGCLRIGDPKSDLTTIVVCPSQLPTVAKRDFPEGRPSAVKELQIAFLQAESAYNDLKDENEAIERAWGACK